MASTVGSRPQQYRFRAEQAREKAAATSDEAKRKALLHDAEQWDRMAEFEAQNPSHDFASDDTLRPNAQVTQMQMQQQEGPPANDDGKAKSS
jgi:hypothetical protein